MRIPAILDRETSDAIVNRRKFIAGQTRGIQRPLEDGRAGQWNMDQLAASMPRRRKGLRCSRSICLREPDEPVEQVVARIVSIASELAR